MDPSTRWTTERRKQAKLTVLVIARDDDLRDALHALLDDLGYAPTAINGPERAPPTLSDYSVVFFDIGLAVDPARAFLRLLAARDDAPPVVVCSDRAHAEVVAEEFGVTSIRKPFDIDRLSAVLDDALSDQTRPRAR